MTDANSQNQLLNYLNDLSTQKTAIGGVQPRAPMPVAPGAAPVVSSEKPPSVDNLAPVAIPEGPQSTFVPTDELIAAMGEPTPAATPVNVEQPPKPAESVDDPEQPAEPVADPVASTKARGPAESISNLRKKNNEYKALVADKEAKAAELESRVVELEQKLKDYESGEALPEKIVEYKQKIDELKKYQHIHALKTSEEYQVGVVQPLAVEQQELTELAKDYFNSPEDMNAVLKRAIQIDNVRDQNAFLSRYFDAASTIEIRNRLKNIKAIRQQAAEWEKDPEVALQELQNEYRTEKERTRVLRTNKMISTATNAWVDTVTELRASGEYPELTPTDDPEHKKWVNGLMTEAQKAFGKYVKDLGILDITDFPPAMAKDLAKRFLLSQIAPTTALSRSQHYARAEALKAKAKRDNEISRPKVGVSAPVVSAAPGRPVQTTISQDADSIVNKVLRK